ncbi:MAG: type II toxin-antitoxin system antitoxin SocA domain-containing protein [Syntrophobacteraceae bacterium]|jgi:hypothetical protein
MSTLDLIRFITRYATESGITLTTVRLVKFVYLADLYFARQRDGHTLTGYPWAFVYYGPYCSEIMEDLDKAAGGGLILRDSRESKFSDSDFHLFSCRDPEADKLEDLFPIWVISPLKRAIKKFSEDTEALLDYVYFETEPMEGVKKGDLLDFGKARPSVRSKPLQFKKLSQQKIEAGKIAIANLKAKAKSSKTNLRNDFDEGRQFFDEVYFESLENMDDEDLKAGLTGKARISPE